MIVTNKRHVGVDQDGGVYWLGAYPCKELSERLHCQHVQKLNGDNLRARQVAHVGYVIAGLWIEVFRAPLGMAGRRAEGVV
jgi:hypothetical protein